MAKKKPSYKGIPGHLVALAKAGKRVRYNGFWLGESERDRAVAIWLDEQKQLGVNPAELIKNFLYSLATGQVVGASFTSTLSPAGETGQDDIDLESETAQAMLNMDD